MLRSVFIALVAVFVQGQTVLQADDAKQPKTAEKPAVKQVQKKQLVLLQKADKTKQPQKQKPAAATLGSDVEYYTTSPAQGRPADGKLPAGTKVKVIDKAGSYVRVMAVIEAYVPADSLKAPDKPVIEKKQPALDKAAALKKKAAAEKEAAVNKKKAAVDKTALKQKAIAEKKAAAEKNGKTAIDKVALKKKAIEEKRAAAEKKTAANKEIEKKGAEKKKVEKK